MAHSSLYQAVKHAILHPSDITLSPTSGFHHARPTEGAGFCTFSGQAIAALKIYQEYGIAGAFIDLDAHFGNSIEDTRSFNTDVNKAIPKGFTINPQGDHHEYLAHFRTQLEDLQQKILNHDIGYVVFCHGADSHEDDDRGGQCTTEQWLECSHMFYDWLRHVDLLRGEPLPCCISLFGGYRSDNYMAVMALHLADLAECLKSLQCHSIPADP